MMRLGGSPTHVVVLVTGYALVHSVLASRQAKDAARRLVGARYRNGLYRIFFNAHAVVLFAWGVRAFLRLPDRTLYRVAPPWSWLLGALQLSGLALMLASARAVGLPRITGLGLLGELLTGRDPAPEPEAQGPPPGPDGEMMAKGPFRFTRHPANWGPLPVVLGFPHMTVNRATLAVLLVAYLVLGSVHEERRLVAAYGDAYRRYQRRAPFLVGLVWRRTPATSSGGYRHSATSSYRRCR